MSHAFSIAEPAHRVCNPFSRRETAVSHEARDVKQAADRVTQATDASQALFGNKSSAISNLFEVSGACGIDDWDGYGAEAIGPVVIRNAEMFIRAFPDELALPAISAAPDGTIVLDWISGPSRLFSVNVGWNARLAYAWLDGTDQGHAVARFDGGQIPLRILEGIRAIVARR